jgi:hypothetical protein
MNWLREPDAEPIPGYRLVCPLGTGGFGEVWKCIAPGNIFKAIKFVYGNLNSLDGDAFRAEQELKALEKIKEVRHPFILSMERIDVIEGDLAIVMELADRSLHDLMQEHQAAGRPGIPRDELLRYLRDAADGLDHLNEKHSLQHLDVKPRNLFLIGERVKVADFGLVKNLERQSTSGLLAGVTPIYAAPETFSGKFTRQSDQYSLAVVYAELLTGKRPFNGKNIRTLALQHVSEQPDLTGIPAHDQTVLLRAMAKDPNKRWTNCMEFVDALEAADPRHAEVNLGATPPATSTTTPPTMPRTKPAAAPRAPSASEGIEHTLPTADVASLRPTVIIGVGEFGRRALLDLRCRLLDRVGDLSQVPIFRFLYLDADPEGLYRAQHGEPETALTNGEVFPLPLQPVGNYRRRALEHLNDWLPREKLYSIPRSLQPQGSRALGRLAFHDNYLRFMTRLRRELQIATHPESLAQSVSQTGLMLRDNQPRICVLAAAGGGSAGMLVDLAYAISRQAAQLHLPQNRPNLFLFCGAPADPATPKIELANVHATLTELNHYEANDTSFWAQYGPDAQKLTDPEQPYSSIYLLTLENRTPEAHRDCLSHVASYLSHEMLTVLGNDLESKRGDRPPGVTSFRSLGTHSIWFPRGLLLRVAARQVASALIGDWQSTEIDESAQDVEETCAKTLSDPGLTWDALAKQIELAAYTPDGTPPEVISRMLSELSEDASRPEVFGNPGGWAEQAIKQVEEWIGSRASTADESVLRRSRFSILYQNAVDFVAEEWERKLLDSISYLMDRPGRRTAAMERAIRQLIAFCDQAAQAQLDVVGRQRAMVSASRDLLRGALDHCRNGSGSLSRLLGMGMHRSVRQFLEQVRHFAFARLAEDTLDAGAQFFKKLRSRLEDRLADLGFVRQRLRHLNQSLSEQTKAARETSEQDDSLDDVVQGSATLRIVLPNGVANLEEAASQFVESLTPEQYHKLDDAIQTLVLLPLGGLQAICRKTSDLGRLLAGPLIDQIAAFLSSHLPLADVADVELSAAAKKSHPLEYHLQRFFRKSAPLVSARDGRNQTTYLLHPGSAASLHLTSSAQRLLPEVELIPGSGPTDLTFCREQGYLHLADLIPILGACQQAYEELRHIPAASPHARFDIPEWSPLEIGEAYGRA